MILVTFQAESGRRLGAKTEGGVVDIAVARAMLGQPSATEQVPDSLEALFRAGEESLQNLAALVETAVEHGVGTPWLLDETNLRFGPCGNPGKIICVGLNYHRYAIESGVKVPETPVLFSKYNNAIAASGESIPLPGIALEYDYEAELGVVIGRQAKNVRPAEALQYVFGYCNANDLSSRDLQRRTSQWLLGKMLDKFLPIGPYLVTADEVADPQALEIRCWVNEELRQNSNTSDMVFPVAELVSYISQHMTLEPGDLISTGTPEGVVLTMQEKAWLKPGDEVSIEIGGLGRLTNVMIRGD